MANLWLQECLSSQPELPDKYLHSNDSWPFPEARKQIAAWPPLQNLLRAYPEWRVLIRIASDSGMPFWEGIFRYI